MADLNMSEELFYVNGLNASTGAYIEDPLSAAQLAGRVLNEAQENWQKAAFKTRAERGAATMGAIIGLDMNDLAQVGWGVIFAANADPAVQANLKELIDHRQQVSHGLCKVYSGPEGYRPSDTWESFRVRHKVSTGLADPQQMPYYILIAGDPETIPFAFQYQLDLERAAGRIYFDDPQDYARYAHSVVAAEQGQLRRARRASFFATSNPNDPPTRLSSQELAAPLQEGLASELAGQWDVQLVTPADATKARLAQLVGGPETPVLLFTATHGAGFDRQDPRQARHQGALVTQDWPGPLAWRKPLSETDHYFSADDVAAAAHVWGMIAMFFACFSAGTPRLSDFYHLKPVQPLEQLNLAEKAMLSALPQRLLAHPNGGALAVIGHVERAWDASFRIPGQAGPDGRDIVATQRMLRALMRGFPLGMALEELNSRYAQFSVALTQELFPIQYQGWPMTDEDQRRIARLWTANNDARNTIVLGDPAVRLPLADPGQIADPSPEITTT